MLTPFLPSRTLLECAEGHVGWCETYLTLLLQNDMLDFVRLSPNEAGQRDLVFPDGRVLVRLPVDLTPQELPPPPTWSRMSYLDVCVANQRYSDEIFETDHDIRGDFSLKWFITFDRLHFDFHFISSFQLYLCLR